jgi:peptide/nickel transport system ATP-binding protein
MIFQEPMTSLNPVYTCGYQVMEAILNHRSYSRTEARDLAVGWFAEVELPEPERIFTSYPHELSGGQRQRVMIAMAVSCEPRLLIADEPTTALDVTIQRSILTLLEQLKERYNMSLIFISHDLAVVSGIADEVAVMHQGAVVEQGHRQQVIHHPRNGYTRGLIACRPPLDYRPERLKTLADYTSGGTAGDAPSPSDRAASKTTEEHERSKKQVVFSLQKVSKDFALKTNFWGRAVEHLRALDQVSLDLRQGETLGLVGESGSGKSTLARLLLYLIRPEEGSLMYKGQDMAYFGRKDMQHFRQQVQIIFQDPYSTLNPRMSVGSMISEPLRYYGLYAGRKERRDRVVELLESVRLGAEYHSRYPHELSGGQRQRVAIARVLALNPEFIICDEAVSALDVSIQAEILNLLQDLKQQFDLTYVFITHDFSVVRFMSDRIAVMKDGRVVETGASDDLFSHPSEPYTRRLLESIPSV